MKHHTVIPVHGSKTGSPLQQRARERNFDLMRLAGISQNLRSILSRNSLKTDTLVGPVARREAAIKECIDILEFRVRASYKEFKEKYNANKSPK